MDYKDFHIRIVAKTEKGFKIQVDSPMGPASEEIELTDDIKAALKHIRTSGGIERGAATREAEYERGDDDSMTSEELGSRLYTALFSGAVGKMYNRSYAALSNPEVGLRIKFHLNLDDEGVSELAQIPWEYIYESDTKEYLNLSRQTPIVRYIEVQRPDVPHAQPVKLKILVVMSSPNGVAALDLEKERSLIKNNWASEENVEVDFLEHPTPDSLLHALVNNQYHVLHYMGHGAYDHKTGAGALILEDEHHDAVMLDAQALGTWLRDAPSIRLIFLNACDTARTDEDEPFAGVANRLVMAGVPAVLAMQFPITDEAAIDFAAAFYPRLVAGFPVDEATSQGRKAILAGKTGTIEWGTPVLYMRAPDGYLFERNSAPPPPEPKPEPKPDPKPTPEPPPSPTWVNPVKILGVAAVAVIALLAYIFATAPDTTWEVTPAELVVGKNTAVNVALAYDNGTKSAYDDDYTLNLKSSSEIEVSRPADAGNSWEWHATASEPGSATFRLEVSYAGESDDQRDLIEFPVTVTLMPEVERQFDAAMAAVENPSITTELAISNLTDSLEQSDYMTRKMVDKLTLARLSLESLTNLRDIAETVAGDQNIELETRVNKMTTWKNAFRETRLEAGPDSADSLLQQLIVLEERLSKVNAKDIILCTEYDACDSSLTRIRMGKNIFVQVLPDPEGLECAISGGNVPKECKLNTSAWRQANTTGEYYVEIRNREDDLILKQNFESF